MTPEQIKALRGNITAMFVVLNRRLNIRPCISACRERERITGKRDECETCQVERWERDLNYLLDECASPAPLGDAGLRSLAGALQPYANGVSGLLPPLNRRLYLDRDDVLALLDAPPTAARAEVPPVVFAVREFCTADFDGTWETVALFATAEQAADHAESLREDRDRASNYQFDVDEMRVQGAAAQARPTREQDELRSRMQDAFFAGVTRANDPRPIHENFNAWADAPRIPTARD